MIDPTSPLPPDFGTDAPSPGEGDVPARAAGSIEHLLRGRPLRVSGFRIEDIIGEGGMGIVYRAVQEPLGRTVALKVIRADHADDRGFRERFAREARLAARLSHPNVVACYDAGVDDDRHWLAMELIEGGDVRQVMASQGGRLPPTLALRIARDVAAGLEAIHGADIVHRDIKPANLLIGPAGQVKIADLGLARPLCDEVLLTSRGITPGTPAFMAPEQARNDPALDHRADIYSLAATLYFLLTGNQPFVGASSYEVVAQILRAPIPDPAAALTDTDPAISAIVRRAGALHARDRYANALEMRLDLERALASLPATAERAPLRSSPQPRATAETVCRPVALPGTHIFRRQAGAVVRKLRAAAMSMSSVIASRPSDEIALLDLVASDLRPLAGQARAVGLSWFADVTDAADRLVTQLLHWPDHIGPSSVRTLRQAIDALERLLAPDAPCLRDGGVHALVVDDDPISRKTMCLALSGVGITPLGVASGQEALVEAERRAFSLVLSDLMMEGMNGFELMTRLRRREAYARTPMLLVTSLNDFGPSFKPSADGATDLIVKPFLLMELGLKCLVHLVGSDERWVRLDGRGPERGVRPA